MNVRSILIAVAASLAIMPGAARAAGPVIPKKVRANIDARIRSQMAPAFVVGLVDADGVTWCCRGTMTYDSKTKVDPATLFEIGSITKAFTGILLADMVERGKVKLDDPIEKYLPADAKAPVRGDRHITLLDLAQHRAGLPRLPGNFDESSDPGNPYQHYDAKRLYEFLAGYQLTQDLPAPYAYSNLSMGLLGHLLSRAAGKPYEALVVERVCKPLGMNDTLITLDADHLARMAPGHDGPKKKGHWTFDCLAPAGGLCSTGQDMIDFMSANLGLRKTPLSAALARAVKPRAATGIPDVDIALAWHVSKTHGTEIIWHNGGTGGYRSFCGFAPAKKLGVVVLTNSGAGADDIGLHLLEPKYALQKTAEPASVPEEVLASYVGYYELSPAMAFHVTLEAGTLYAQLTGQDAVPVYPSSETEFDYRAVKARLTFERNGDKVTGLVLHQNGRDMPAKRMGDDYKPPAPVERKAIGLRHQALAEFVGRYELHPGVVFDVQAEGNHLTVQITGQPRLPVYPESATKFFYKAVDAQITFARDAKGRVDKLVLHQSGMDQTAKRLPG